MNRRDHVRRWFHQHVLRHRQVNVLRRAVTWANDLLPLHLQETCSCGIVWRQGPTLAAYWRSTSPGHPHWSNEIGRT